LTFQSCIIYNSTKQTENNVCEIHKERMYKTFVRATYGRICNAKLRPEYKNAKSIMCMGCVVKSPRKYFALRYYCKKCNKLRRKDKQYWKDRYAE
jgi:hypothetical protein